MVDNGDKLEVVVDIGRSGDEGRGGRQQWQWWKTSEWDIGSDNGVASDDGKCGL